MDEHNSSKITGNILCQVSNAHKDFVLKNRSYLKTLLDILLYLGRQGIAIWGNIENEESLNRGFINVSESQKYAVSIVSAML